MRESETDERERNKRRKRTLNGERDGESARVFSYKCPWFGGLGGKIHWFSLEGLEHAKHVDGQLAELHLSKEIFKITLLVFLKFNCLYFKAAKCKILNLQKNFNIFCYVFAICPSLN